MEDGGCEATQARQKNERRTSNWNGLWERIPVFYSRYLSPIPLVQLPSLLSSVYPSSHLSHSSTLLTLPFHLSSFSPCFSRPPALQPPQVLLHLVHSPLRNTPPPPPPHPTLFATPPETSCLVVLFYFTLASVHFIPLHHQLRIPFASCPRSCELHFLLCLFYPLYRVQLLQHPPLDLASFYFAPAFLTFRSYQRRPRRWPSWGRLCERQFTKISTIHTSYSISFYLYDMCVFFFFFIYFHA